MFYVGQPVVCIREEWTFPPVFNPPQPKLGQRFTVERYLTSGVIGGVEYPLEDLMIKLREISSYWYAENHFAPITDEQVRGIIEEAHKLGPWTGGTHWDGDKKKEKA